MASAIGTKKVTAPSIGTTHENKGLEDDPVTPIILAPNTQHPQPTASHLAVRHVANKGLPNLSVDPNEWLLYISVNEYSTGTYRESNHENIS